jgi:predicted DNA-binding protein
MAAKTFKPVACYLTTAQIQRLRAIAARTDRPVAWCIRAAVDSYIKQKRGGSK